MSGAPHCYLGLMNIDLRATWEQYVRAWKLSAPNEKRALLLAHLDEACIYRDPLIEVRGTEELLAYMHTFHQQMPGGQFVTREFVCHHQRSLATWSMLNGEGIAVGTGSSYAEYNASGKLLCMTGFFEVQRAP
jgi:hypothetical protein